MDEDRVNRIRYNVNIQHSRAGCGTGLTSPAVFSEALARPLIERPADWDVLINKFKIDTFSIPITIVKLKEFQPLRGNGSYETDYTVFLRVGLDEYSATCMFTPEQNKDVKPSIVRVREDGYVKYDNTGETFFVYSYEHILDMINNAIEDVCKQANLDDAPFFSYEPSQQHITIQYPWSLNKEIC